MSVYYNSLQNTKMKKISCLIMEKIFLKKTCLHIACGFGKLEIVRFIVLNCKHLIPCVDELGRNALHYAIKSGNWKILKFLLAKTVWLQNLAR